MECVWLLLVLQVERKKRSWSTSVRVGEPKQEGMTNSNILALLTLECIFISGATERQLCAGKWIALALKDPLSKKCPKNIRSWARPCKYWMKSVNIWSYVYSFSERGFSAPVWFIPTPAHHWSQQHQFSAGSVYFWKALTDLWKGRRRSQTGFQYLYYWRKGSLSVVLSKNGERQILDIYIPVWLFKNIRATWLLHNCN